MNTNPPDHHDSSVLEKILEHQLVASLSACLWKRGFRDFEVLRSEVDAFGHDLVIEAGGIIRHVQLKASTRQAKTARVNINTRLALKPSGCVIWFLHDPETLEIGPFRWFGGLPGEKMPELGNIVGKHSKADSLGHKAERNSIRVLAKGRFTVIEEIGEIADLLFGQSQTAAINLLL